MCNCRTNCAKEMWRTFIILFPSRVYIATGPAMDVVANILVFFTISIFQGAETYAPRHTGGREEIAKDGQFPFQALIRVKYGNAYPACNGIILSPEYVLTAAGCIKHSAKSVDDLEVVVGVTSANTRSSSNYVQKSSAKNLLVHPMWYTTNGKLADIALLTVHPKFEETFFVKWAGIDHRLKSSRVLISGWGRTERLVYFEGQVYEEDICNRALSNEIPLSTICIGSTRSRKLLSTKIYAGAGVGNGNSIYGIVSSGKNGVATVITHYKSWIESVIYRSLDEETMETDRDSEGSDEAIPPAQHAIQDHSSIHGSTEYLKPSPPSFDDGTIEDVKETASTEEDDETEISPPYTTPKRSSSYSTVSPKTFISSPSTLPDEPIPEESSKTHEVDEIDEPKPSIPHGTLGHSSIHGNASPKPFTSMPTTSFEEEMSEESSDIEETEKSEPSMRYVMSKNSLIYRTTPSEPSIPISESSSNEETSEETDETDENYERAILDTERQYFHTSTRVPFKPLNTEPSPLDEQRSEESSESNETEGSGRSALYNIFQSSSISRTIPSRLPIVLVNTSFAEEILAESTEIDETEDYEVGETAEFDSLTHSHKVTKLLRSGERGGMAPIHYSTDTRNSLGPDKLSEETKNDGMKDILEQYNGADMTDDVLYEVKKPDKFQPSGMYVIHRRQEPQSSMASFETSRYSLPTNKYDVNNPPPIPITRFNSTFVANENNTKTANVSHSEPVSSASIKLFPSLFAIILSYLLGILVTRNLL